MNDTIRNDIALYRYKLISPILAEPRRIQNDYFRTQSQTPHTLPHLGEKQLTVSTLKRWLRLYRTHGFDGLKPKVRSDCGRPRRLQGDAWQLVKTKCDVFPHWTIAHLYQDLRAHGQLGEPPISYNTLARLIKADGLLTKASRTDVRKRFEHAEVNELWVCDFMHGPDVACDGRRRKAILCAVIDDHSRIIVGAQWFAHETVSVLSIVLKDAFAAYGIPKRLYVDNGAAFSSDLLIQACARGGISLIHSKPYDSPSRGKIERFFRTVRQRFILGLAHDVTLADINLAFACWLRDDYHEKPHRGIDQTPLARYQASAGRLQLRRLSEAELSDLFWVRHERVVNNDATISFRGTIYEVPAAYIRQRIELRHPVDEPTGLVLFDRGHRITALKPVDTHENAQTFRPTPGDATVSFAQGKVTR